MGVGGGDGNNYNNNNNNNNNNDNNNDKNTLQGLKQLRPLKFTLNIFGTKSWIFTNWTKAGPELLLSSFARPLINDPTYIIQ